MTRRLTQTWIAAVALCVAATGAAADEITFAGLERAYPGVVVSVNDKAVELRVPIGHVAGFKLGRKRSEGFPDTIQFAGHNAPGRARVLGFMQGSLWLRVPRAAVTAIRMTVPGSPAGTKPKSKPVAAQKTGRAQGHILIKKEPARNVEVRVVRVSYSTFLGQRKAEHHESFLARTGRDGAYAFEKLPAGSYKIYLRIKPGDGWARRLRTKPDFEVSAGRVTQVDPVRIPRRIY